MERFHLRLVDGDARRLCYVADVQHHALVDRPLVVHRRTEHDLRMTKFCISLSARTHGPLA